jgi:hypothetical protein
MEAAPARRHEGDADDLVEDGLIAVPADGGARAVFGDQHVLEIGRAD